MQAIFLMPRALRRDLGRGAPGACSSGGLQAADALIYEEIARRRAQADLEERTDVLSLAAPSPRRGRQPMSDAELRDELMTMLLAGHETTATGLAFAFDLLLRNPGCWRACAMSSSGDDDAYLNAVVTESLRLRPVIDAAERTLTRPRTIGGWELPAGIRVYPAGAVVHLREDIYPQASVFRPERFLDEGAQPYTWVPFGGGIRRCIGAALAQAEMAEVIRVVVDRADLEPLRPESEPVVMRGITLVPKHGTPIRVKRVAARSATKRPAEPVAG